MRFGLIMVFVTMLSGAAFGQSIDPDTTEFPWKNGPTRDSVYKLSENGNKVHVFEVFANFCGWCHRNATQVADLAASYEGDDRVQVVDLGIDTSDTEISRWIAQHSPDYPVVKDLGRTVYSALKSTDGIPQTFVVNCRGELAGATVGYWGAAEKAEINAAIATAKEVTCE